MIETAHDSLAFNSTLNSRRHSDHRLQRDSLVSADTLIEFLENRLGVDKFDKEMLYSLTEKLRKDKDNKFAFQELFSICMSCLSSVKEKMDFSWSQLHKVLSEKQEIEKNVQKLKSAEKQRYGEALYEDLLRIKIWEVRDLVIASGQKVFIRISCDDITFSTRVHDYLTSTFEEAFYEFFVKKGLEKIKIQAILANEQEDILGELEIPVKGSNLEMEQNEWRVLTSAQDGISVCGEVRLSVKLVPLRGELTKGPIGEIEHKIKMQTEEVEGLEKIYKSFNIIISALKDYNSGNTVSYRNTVGDFNDERCLSSNGFVDRRISLGNEDQGLEGSGRKTYLKEKKRILPPLGFQKLDSARAVETVALKKEPTLKNSRQSGNPTKSEVCSQNYHSAPKLETSSVNQRNSLVNLLELFNSPVKDLGVNSNQVKAFSAVKHQDSSEWEAEKREDSYQNQSSGSNDQANWKKENLRLNGIIRNLQEENKVLLNEIQKLKHTDQKVKECRDKMSVLIGELNRVQAIVKEKEEEVIHWKKQSEKNNSFDFEEVQGKIKKLVDENQRLRDIALKAHNESVYYKNQCESYGEGKNKIDSLLKEIEVLRTVNQNLNQEQIEKEEILQKLRRENVSLKQNNMTFSNELAKRDGLLERLKTEASTSHSTLNTRTSVKGNKGVTNENVYKLDSRKNQSYQPLQPWNFLNTEQ